MTLKTHCDRCKLGPRNLLFESWFNKDEMLCIYCHNQEEFWKRKLVKDFKDIELSQFKHRGNFQQLILEGLWKLI